MNNNVENVEFDNWVKDMLDDIGEQEWEEWEELNTLVVENTKREEVEIQN